MPSLQENTQSVTAYYAAVMPEYDEVCKLDSQPVEEHFARLKAMYQELFRGQDVLEVACGTGYWTGVLAQTARSVLATDANSTCVEQTSKKLASLSNVRVQLADAYALDTLNQTFSAAFAHFWWSHVPRKALRPFLEGLHSRLQPGSLVLFADCLYYDAENRRIDEHGDLYEPRTLQDGRRFETIKNFPTKQEIIETLQGLGDGVDYQEHPEGVWTVTYRVKR